MFCMLYTTCMDRHLSVPFSCHRWLEAQETHTFSCLPVTIVAALPTNSQVILLSLLCFFSLLSLVCVYCTIPWCWCPILWQPKLLKFVREVALTWGVALMMWCLKWFVLDFKCLTLIPTQWTLNKTQRSMSELQGNGLSSLCDCHGELAIDIIYWFIKNFIEVIFDNTTWPCHIQCPLYCRDKLLTWSLDQSLVSCIRFDV